MSSSSSARISISSDEVNLLVYRYLIEAGFKHSAFVFHGESLLHRTPNLVQADMPPGSLVSLLQKSLLFLYLESHIGNDGKQISCDEPFSLFKPHEHEYGPIEVVPKFEETHIGNEKLKRSESVDGDDEDIRQMKKQKQSTKNRVDESLAQTSVNGADTSGDVLKGNPELIENEMDEATELTSEREDRSEVNRNVEQSSSNEEPSLEPQ